MDDTDEAVLHVKQRYTTTVNQTEEPKAKRGSADATFACCIISNKMCLFEYECSVFVYVLI